MLETLDRDGAALLPFVLTPEAATNLREFLAPVAGGAGNRSLHETPFVRELTTSGPLAESARHVLGPKARVARVLYFDKQPGANWKVPWHQDLTIAVAERHETEGYAAWSVKAGIPHVQPPADILEHMVAVRLHLDDCGPENGPLRISPGTHRQGRIPESQIEALVQRHGNQEMTAKLGDVILMRPLCLHASSPATSPHHRRVLHVEYAAADLPFPLAWHLGWPVEDAKTPALSAIFG